MPVVSQGIADSPIQNLLFEKHHSMLEMAVNIRSVEKAMIGDVKKESVDGKYYRLDQLTAGNFRLSGRFAGAYLPGQNPSSAVQDVAAPLGTLELRYKRRNEYSSVEFDGPMNNAPLSSAGGYEKLSAIVLEQSTKAFPEMISSKLARGDLDIKGEVQSVAGNVVTLVAANAPTTAATSRPWAGIRYFREGDVCDIITRTSAGVPNPLGATRTGATDRGRRITAITRDNTAPALTFQDLTGTTILQGDLLCDYDTREGTAITTQAQYEDALASSQGIMDCVQDGVDALYSKAYYGNVQVSSSPMMQSFKVTNTNNTDLTVAMANQLIRQMYSDALGGKDPDFIYCTMDVMSAFARPFTTMANFATNNPTRFQSPGKGFTPVVGVVGIEVNNIGTTGSKKFMVSPFAPNYRAYFIRKDSLMFLQDKELGVMTDDGLRLRQVPGKDNWSVSFKRYCAGVVTMKPNDNGYIVGLNGDVNNA